MSNDKDFKDPFNATYFIALLYSVALAALTLFLVGSLLYLNLRKQI